MPKYQINIYCYKDEFSEEWCTYMKSLLKVGKIGQQINVCTCYTNESPSAFDKFLKNSCFLVVLLTDSMINFLGNEGLQVLNDLQKKSGIVGILCYADRSKMESIVIQNVWTFFEAKEDTSDNKDMIGNILDILESVVPKPRSMRRTKVRKLFTVIPTEIRKPNQTIAIIFYKEEIGKVEVTIGKDGKRIEAKELNKNTCSVKLPMTESGTTKLYVYNNGEKIGQHPLIFIPPNLKDYSCPQFLCQMFGLAGDDKDGLDEELVKLYENTAPEDDALNTLLGAYTSSKRQYKSDAELPTLLHFAASNGLSQFCTLLLDTPGSLAAFQVENKDGLDPADLAEKSGHTQLAEFLRVFVETEATVQACDEIYMEMRGCSLYSNFVNHTDDESDYENENKVFDLKKDTADERVSRPVPPMPSPKDFMFKEHPRTLSGSTSQDELIELAQSVKDGEFNVEEAERLYESWKQRNHTPTKSIKDRHAELKKIQETYTSVFEMVNKDNKKKSRKTLLEKMRSKLGKKKSVPNIQISEPIIERPPIDTPTENRYSSSSMSSRDSLGSQQVAEGGSESDDLIEEEDVMPISSVERRKVSSASLGRRMSFREDYLNSFESCESSEAPQLPPRRAPPIPPRKY